MINEATRAKKLGHDLTNILNPNTNTPLKPLRGDPRGSTEGAQKKIGYISVFSRLEPRIKPVFDEINNGNFNEIKNTIFVSFTEIEKLGLNPRSKYDTPKGIYSYQLDEKNYEQLLTNNLPFATNKPFIQFFKIKPQYFDNIAVYKSGIKNVLPPKCKSIKECHSIFCKKYPAIVSDFFFRDTVTEQEVLDFSEKDAFLKQFHEITIVKSKKFFGKADDLHCLWSLGHSLKNSNKWTHLFVNDFGIYGVIDDSGLIHHKEPRQSVFFSSMFIQHLAQIDNPYLGPKNTGPYKPAQYWYKKNKKDGSIEEYYNKTLIKKEWKNENNELHRLNGPAIIDFYSNKKIKSEVWYKNGIVNRETGPASICFDDEGNLLEQKWILDGAYFRTEGPAYILYNVYGDIEFQDRFFINGEFVTPQKYYEYVKNKNTITESKSFLKIKLMLK